VLETVDHGHVRPEQQAGFQVLHARAVGVGGGVETVGFNIQEAAGQQFHRHRSHLGNLAARLTLHVVRQVGRFKHVERVPGLVQDGLQIIVQADRIGKDERALDDREIGAVRAGAFVLAVFQVEQVFPDHGAEVFAQVGVNRVEHRARFGDQLVDGLKWAQRGSLERVNVQIPRAQALHAQPGAPARVDAFGGGHHHALDRIQKAHVIFGGVIEAQQVQPAKGAVIGEAGVRGDLAAHGQQLLPQRVDRFAVGQLAARSGAPGALALAPVRRLHQRTKLRDGQFLAVPFHRLRAQYAVVFG